MGLYNMTADLIRKHITILRSNHGKLYCYKYEAFGKDSEVVYKMLTNLNIIKFQIRCIRSHIPARGQGLGPVRCCAALH